MTNTPGFVIPTVYESPEALQDDIQRRNRESGFTIFDPNEFDEESLGESLQMTANVDDFLAHFGVKGMKWGVVKERYKETRDTPAETLVVTTSNGKEVTLVESRKGRIASALGAVSSPEKRERIKDYRNFDMYVDGKNVGGASLNHESKDEVNLVWLGVNPSERGKGYGSSAFDAGIEYARSKGYKKITLEVPNNAPDALHIYEKRGFKLGEQISTAEDDPVWGGLTKMEYTIPRKGR